MDESAEGESIVPASGEGGHGDRVIFQPILNPHQDHLLCTRARPCSCCRCGKVCWSWRGGVGFAGLILELAEPCEWRSLFGSTGPSARSRRRKRRLGEARGVRGAPEAVWGGWGVLEAVGGGRGGQ